MLLKLTISRNPRSRVRKAGPDRARGAATSTATTAAGRLRVAVVLCSLLFAAFGLPGCRSQVLVKPEVTITAATDVREAGTPLVFTVRVNPAPAKGMTFHVEIDAAGCMLPEQLQLPRQLTIDAGDEEVTFTVQTDGIEMGGEEGCALTVRLTEGDGAQTLHVTVLVTVPDPEVSVTAGASPVAEGTDVEFTLTATPAPAAPLTVAVNWSETGSFLTGPRPSEVTIPTSGTVTVSASTEDDGVHEPDGTVTLTVEGRDGYTVGTQATADVTVTDDDVPAVSVAAGPSPVAEGTDVSFTLTATPAPASPLTVAVGWSETGSFLTGTRPETVTIPTSGTATVSASTEDDGVHEPDGTVTLTVEGRDGYTVGTQATADVTVTDDDVPAVSLTAVTSSVNEGENVSFTLTATPAPAVPLTVAVRWSETGSFLTGTRPSGVTIPTSGTATVSASTEDDGVDEADGTVTLTVEGRDGYTVGTQATADVTVTDDDVPAVSVPAVSVPPVSVATVSVATVTSPVAEGTNVEFTLTATPAPAAPLTVAVRWSERGSFLTGTRPSEVTIPTSGTATVSASTEDDGVDEADGTVTLTVTGGSGYTVGMPSSAAVTVTDDVPAVSVAAVTSPVNKGENVKFTLTATPAPAKPLTVHVIWTQTGNVLAAGNGGWHSYVSLTSREARIVTGTTNRRPGEEGTVTLRVASGSGYTVGTPSSATITVNDPGG